MPRTPPVIYRSRATVREPRPGGRGKPRRDRAGQAMPGNRTGQAPGVILIVRENARSAISRTTGANITPCATVLAPARTVMGLSFEVYSPRISPSVGRDKLHYFTVRGAERRELLTVDTETDVVACPAFLGGVLTAFEQ